MKIESHLQPNCSESSWRVTGPKKELEALKKKFLDRCNSDEHTEWIKETWEDISNVDKLVRGLVKPVKEKK